MAEITGKVVIVSGAAGGIGQEIVRALSHAGAIVVAADRDENALQKLGALTRVQTLAGDVRNAADWEKIFDHAAALGPIYALINAVGVLKPGYIDTVTTKDIDFHIDINVKGVILGSSIAARELKRNCAGHIINIASLAGVAPIPGIGLYSASKFAVRGFTLALAAELKDSGVFVTVVCPDAVKTPMLDLQKDYPEAALTFSGTEPLTAAEIANVIIATLGKNEAEITLPFWRGVFAKAASALPNLAPMMIDNLRKIGLQHQADYEKN
ncbi:MAG: SDR family oxidoreductase [Spirochaetes bacterium]|nr:SDR family oxidoreductase [Spirochaetota bacterium]